MKHYQILNLPHNCSLQEIKKRYHQLVLRYHPDKNIDTSLEFFHKIQEAYEVLSDEDRRREYDIESKLHRFNPSDYIFTEEDYRKIFDYVRVIQSSVEYRFMMSLICKIPTGYKDHLNTKFANINRGFQTHEFFKKIKRKRVLNMNTVKTIDITELYEDITLHLHISLEKVYNGFCNEIMILCRGRIVRLFVTKSNYVFRTYNDTHTVILEFYTDQSNYKIIDNSLVYTYTMNLFEYYYEDMFRLCLPNNVPLTIHRKKEVYDNLGLLKGGSSKPGRGKLYIRYLLKHDKPRSEHKELMRMIFTETK